MIRTQISILMLIAGVGLGTLGLAKLPEAHHIGVLMTALLVSSLGLTLLTYIRLQAAQEHKSII